MVQIYGIYRLDIVLILGQVGGIVTYVRNIMLAQRSAQVAKTAEAEASVTAEASTTADKADTVGTVSDAVAAEVAVTETQK